MFASQIKAGAISAIALAMTLGLAAPASATTFTLSSDKASLSINDQVATLTTDATGDDNVSAIFVNGEFYGTGLGVSNGAFIPWSVVGPCATVDVTLRMYYVAPGSPPPVGVPTLATPYAAEVLIEFVGSAAAPCDPTWGTGLEDEDEGESGGSDDSGEPLAKTGSDASAVAGLTGVAGVAALAVAAAVALRTRRAQR